MKADIAKLKREIEAAISRSGVSHEDAGDLLLDLAVDQACLETGWPANRNERAIMSSAAGARMAECGLALSLEAEARAMANAAPSN